MTVRKLRECVVRLRRDALLIVCAGHANMPARRVFMMWRMLRLIALALVTSAAIACISGPTDPSPLPFPTQNSR